MDLKIKITNKNIYKSNYNFNKFKDKRDSKTLSKNQNDYLHNILRRSSYKAKKGKISTLSSQV
jgi:hypothetical protein